MATQPDRDTRAPRLLTPIDQEDDGMPTLNKLPSNNALPRTFDQAMTAEGEDPR